MSFQKASTSFTRFRIIDDIPADLWASIPEKLRQYAFIDIDDIAEERASGWTNFDDMLDTEWRQSPPEKGDFLTFSLRLDTRRIPPAVLRKHVRLALRDEEERIKELSPYAVTSPLMQNAAPTAIFMHCLPAFHDLKTTIGKQIHEKFGLTAMEVTDEVFESSQSIVFDEAENHLHAQKAVLVKCLA